jgi:hypothetical protein
MSNPLTCLYHVQNTAKQLRLFIPIIFQGGSPGGRRLWDFRYQEMHSRCHRLPQLNLPPPPKLSSLQSSVSQGRRTVNVICSRLEHSTLFISLHSHLAYLYIEPRRLRTDCSVMCTAPREVKYVCVVFLIAYTGPLS